MRCAVTAQLIGTFVFTYAKSRFSHDAAHCQGHKIPAKQNCFMFHHFNDVNKKSILDIYFTL